MINALIIILCIIVYCVFAVSVTTWAVSGHIHEALHSYYSKLRNYDHSPSAYTKQTAGFTLAASLVFPIALLYGVTVRLLGLSLPRIRAEKAEKRAREAEAAKRKAELENARLMAEIKSFDPESVAKRAVEMLTRADTLTTRR